MARYQVPQFLEIEDKIFGPLTLKQFLYSMGGGAMLFISFSVMPKIVAIFVGVPICALFLGLAFYKVNNRPLSLAIESFFKFAGTPKLYIWKKEKKKPVRKTQELIQKTNMDVPSLSGSKLKDLSWGLDIHETITSLDSVSKNLSKTNVKSEYNFKI